MLHHLMVPTAFKKYQQLLTEKMEKAFQQEREIREAASYISNTLKNKGWIYACGTGHSHMLAEEVFYRAGGFARVRPLLLPKLMLHESATGSTTEERKEGYAPLLFNEYVLTENDVLVISSNSGRNSVPIELASFAKQKGAKIIIITNLAHSQSVASRHSSGLKLYQLGNVVLDNFGEIGDSALYLEGLNTPIGPTSTVIGSAILQAVCIEATAQLLAQGIVPEVFASSNSDQGEAHNDALLDTYKPLVKML
ncbi:MAG: SIS domain-containing protein [Bacteroidetes bacterium]|nr:SIS domain-containing protein [Bacteroidota bacterium]